jgi:hypothetical protein
MAVSRLANLDRVKPQFSDKCADLFQIQRRAERCLEQGALVAVGPDGVGLDQLAHGRFVEGTQQIAKKDQPSEPRDSAGFG